jgi:hypothetical protein
METAFHVRYHYSSERLYCPRAVEETLERIDSLNADADAPSLAELVNDTLALRNRLPGEPSPTLAQLFIELDALSGEIRVD